jgi:SAM-dependent methyltransferase
LETDVKQAEHNAKIWSGGGLVGEYDTRDLLPAEVLLLVRYREAFTGRVLEVGVGAGRLLGYLVQLGGEVHGIDISQDMVDHCRRLWPTADLKVGDLSRLSETVRGPFDAILLGDNVIDVFDDERRRSVLSDIHGLLGPGGMLAFSTHNLAAVDVVDGGPVGGTAVSQVVARVQQLANRSPAWMAQAAVRMPRRRANRQKLAPLEHRAADHAILNDEAHDYALLHYYIRSEDQRRQLHELGFETLEVLEAGGEAVDPGRDGTGPWLYYVSKPV